MGRKKTTPKPEPTIEDLKAELKALHGPVYFIVGAYIDLRNAIQQKRGYPKTDRTTFIINDKHELIII